MAELNKGVDIKAGLLSVCICIAVAALFWSHLPILFDGYGNLPGIVVGGLLLAFAVIPVLMLPRLSRRDPTLKWVMIAIVASFVLFGGAVADLASVLNGTVASGLSPQNGRKHKHVRWRSAASWRPGV